MQLIVPSTQPTTPQTADASLPRYFLAAASGAPPGAPPEPVAEMPVRAPHTQPFLRMPKVLQTPHKPCQTSLTVHRLHQALATPAIPGAHGHARHAAGPVAGRRGRRRPQRAHMTMAFWARRRGRDALPPTLVTSANAPGRCVRAARALAALAGESLGAAATARRAASTRQGGDSCACAHSAVSGSPDSFQL